MVARDRQRANAKLSLDFLIALRIGLPSESCQINPFHAGKRNYQLWRIITARVIISLSLSFSLVRVSLEGGVCAFVLFENVSFLFL